MLLRSPASFNYETSQNDGKKREKRGRRMVVRGKGARERWKGGMNNE